MADVTPPNHETFRKARSRAAEKWGVDAETKFLGLLVTGQLQAWEADESGSTKPLLKEYWQGAGRRLCLARINEINGMRGLPVFLKEDLQREMPSHLERRAQQDAERRAQHGEKAGSSTPTIAPKSKGGAPAKYDWDAMWIEAVRIVHAEGLPENPADLRRKLLQWFVDTKGRAPGETVMKEKMTALYLVMRGDDTNGR
jgi:hypothetical protein